MTYSINKYKVNFLIAENRFLYFLFYPNSVSETLQLYDHTGKTMVLI